MKHEDREQALRRVIFQFQDGTQMSIEGKELEDWETICSMHSDYLLPGNRNHVLATGYGGLVKGWVPPAALKGARP